MAGSDLFDGFRKRSARRSKTLYERESWIAWRGGAGRHVRRQLGGEVPLLLRVPVDFIGTSWKLRHLCTNIWSMLTGSYNWSMK